MQAHYRTANGRLTFELTGDQKEIFEGIAQVQEVFEEEQCGRCGNKSLRFVVRTVDDKKYHEVHCTNSQCRAKLAFGQSQKGGTLFPKRKLKADGTPATPKDKEARYDHTHRGWHFYKPAVAAAA